MDSFFDLYENNQDMIDLHNLVSVLTNIIDDFIDKDKPVAIKDMLDAFEIALIKLPLNPIYKKISDSTPHLWSVSLSNYVAANFMESTKNDRFLEISYGLRNCVANILVLAISSTFTKEKSNIIIPAMWFFIFQEPLKDYLTEHLK